MSKPHYHDDAGRNGRRLADSGVEQVQGYFDMASVDGPTGRGLPMSVAQQKQVGLGQTL